MGHYKGPMFPDAGGATFTVAAVAAELALGNPLTAFGGPLENLRARARVAGAGGNSITLEFTDDALSTTGDLEEDTTAKTVHVKFVDGITTALDIVSMVNAGSSLIELVGTSNPSDLFRSDDDEFSPTSLAGGADGRFGVLARYWGPHFPDGADAEPPAVEPIGPDAVATFALKIESGVAVTYSWSTGVIKTYSGLESRSSLLDDPRQTYDGSALLLGDEARDVRNQLARYAALGRPFLLGLSYEETVVASVSGLSVTVVDAASLDWANPGQRVVVIGAAATHDAVIQSVAGNVIALDEVSGAVAAGARIMPAMAVLLEPTQTFSRYRTADGADVWKIRARAALYGFVAAAVSAELDIGDPLTSTGNFDGATLVARTPGEDGNSITVEFADDALTTEGELDEGATTVNVKFVDGETTVRNVRDLLASGSSLVRFTGTVNDLDATLTSGQDEFAATALTGGLGASSSEMGRNAELTTYGGRPIWDRGVLNPDTIDDSLQSLSELVDLGGIPIGIGAADVPDWGRHVALTDRLRSSEWQWLKLFLFTVRGRWESWWLSTYRRDLIPIGNGPGGGGQSGELVVDSTIGEFDLWFSRGYTMIEVVQASGTYYLSIEGSQDNGDGTRTLEILADVLDPEATVPEDEPITRISWLERVRFESDELTVRFTGAQFAFSADARVVQR